MTLRDRIKQIFKRHPRHPFDALWKWGTRRKHAVGKRFRALQLWAMRHAKWAADHETGEWRFWHTRAKAYQRKKRKWLENHQDPHPPPSSDGWISFDGHLVAAWMVRQVLEPARASGVWNGSVFSGYRSPEYCEQLCYNLCGHPSCSGTCAGRSSNHCGPPTFKGVPYEGAIDVSDPYGLRRWCEAHGNPLHGGGQVLPNDVPHFSRSGR